MTVYPYSVSVKLNMINGIQANSNSEELEKLGNIDKEAFSITEDADRKKQSNNSAGESRLFS